MSFMDVIQFSVSWVEALMHKLPMIPMLLFAQVLDTVSGLTVAMAQRKLNSTTSWRGMARKVMTLFVVMVACIIQRYLPEMPVANTTALYFVVSECVSILEKAGAMGVPMPAILLDALEKLQAARHAKLAQNRVVRRRAGDGGESALSVQPMEQAAFSQGEKANHNLPGGEGQS